MRCSQCGLPLSPKRSGSSCPRCGTPVGDQTRLESAPAPTNVFAPDDAPTEQVPPVHPYTNINQSNSVAPAAVNTYIPLASNWQNAGPPQASFPPPDNWQNMPPSGPEPHINMQQPAWTTPPSLSTNYPNNPGQPFAHKPYSPARSQSKTTRIGFTIAGLCIIAGGLLLVFVYFIGQGLLPKSSGTATTPGTTQQAKTVVANQKPTPTIVPTPTAPGATPTPTVPGRGLLDMSVLSNNFNEQTGQVIQQAASFQINQRIYVVLSLHPGGSSHAVCLKWYLNNQLINPYAFQVDPASNYNYYSYTTMGTAGSGRIDISLASTTACADAILAQKLSFTVG